MLLTGYQRMMPHNFYRFFDRMHISYGTILSVSTIQTLKKIHLPILQVLSSFSSKVHSLVMSPSMTLLTGSSGLQQRKSKMTNNPKSEDELKSELIAEVIWERYRLACINLVNSSEVEQSIRASEILNELNEWKQCENAFFNLIHLDAPDINSAGDIKQLNEVEQFLSAFKALSTSDEAKRCLQSIEPFGKADPETKRLLNSGEFYALPPDDQIDTLGDFFFYCDALISFQNSEKYEHYCKKYPDVDVPLKILHGCNEIGVIHKKFVEWKLVAGLLIVVCASDESRDLDDIIHIVLQFIMEIPGKEYLSKVFLP